MFRKITHRVRIQTQIQDQTLSNIWQCTKYLLKTHLCNICEFMGFHPIPCVSTRTEHDSTSVFSCCRVNHPKSYWHRTTVISLAPRSEARNPSRDLSFLLLIVSVSFLWPLYVDTLDFSACKHVPLK